jgi:hypothetical protein
MSARDETKNSYAMLSEVTRVMESVLGQHRQPSRRIPRMGNANEGARLFLLNKHLNLIGGMRGNANLRVSITKEKNIRRKRIQCSGATLLAQEP